jgi:hypothetical protein
MTPVTPEIRRSFPGATPVTPEIRRPSAGVTPVAPGIRRQEPPRQPRQEQRLTGTQTHRPSTPASCYTRATTRWRGYPGSTKVQILEKRLT